MVQTYSYKESYSWGFAFLALVGLAGIVYSIMEPFDLAVGSLTVLTYPMSKYVVILVGLIFIAYAIHKFFKIKAINSASEPIELSADTLSFQAAKGYSLVNTSFKFTQVNELWNQEDDDGESMILYTDDGKHRHEFFADNFESMGKFAAFKKTLEEKCLNITNRD